MAAPRVLPSVLVAALGLSQVSVVEVYTPGELTVRNGTEARLQCTFSSTEVISSAASVTWGFQAEGAPSGVWFFYYSNERAYPGRSVQFKDRVTWAGDLNKRDASINITNIQFQDNGTYLCYVSNPPDTVVTRGEIRLLVVERASLGQTALLLRLPWLHPSVPAPTLLHTDSVDHDYSVRNILGLAVAGVILLLLVFIVVTDHLFWKEERHKMLANMENKQRFPIDRSRTT